MSLTTVNEVRTNVLSLQSNLEDIIGMIMARICEETDPSGDNIEWIRECAGYVEVLKGNLVTLRKIGDHAEEALTESLSFEGDTAEVTPAGLRTLTIEVSQGMLNQHLLTLTDAKRQKLVKDGERFKIELPDGTAFTTELCDPGNKLRERGFIRKFYKENEVKEGDKVVLEEVSRGSWQLKIGQRAYQGGAIDDLIATLQGDKKSKPQE